MYSLPFRFRARILLKRFCTNLPNLQYVQMFFQAAGNAFYTTQQIATVNSALTTQSSRLDTAETKISSLETASTTSSSSSATVCAKVISNFLPHHPKQFACPSRSIKIKWFSGQCDFKRGRPGNCDCDRQHESQYRHCSSHYRCKNQRNFGTVYSYLLTRK